MNIGDYYPHSNGLDDSADFFPTPVNDERRVCIGELVALKSCEHLFAVQFTKHRPNWLTNPDTNRQLEIDMYNENIKFGVEYNGKHHDEFDPVFHKTLEGFDKMQANDRLKIAKCKENGIALVIVSSTVPIINICHHIAVEAAKLGIFSVNAPLDNLDGNNNSLAFSRTFETPVK